MCGRPERIFEHGHELFLTARGGCERAAGGGEAGGRGIPSCVRPRKEADLDLRLGAHPSEPVELCVGEHAHSASLRHAVHRYLESCSLIEDGLETRRALRARNLDPELRPVGKALPRRRQLVEVARRQPELAEYPPRDAHCAAESRHTV